MKIVVSGGSGFVGGFIVERLIADGHAVTILGRTAPHGRWCEARFIAAALDADRDWHPVFDGADAFVHAAFDHITGRYRGGEGDDPERFRARNLDATVAMFEAAKAAGIRRTVFISSRAVYGTHADGTRLTEDTEPRPDTLYGQVKLEGENALAAMSDDGFAGMSLRVTGVYGDPGPEHAHKWRKLFSDFLSGRAIASAVSTEVHGEDVAQAVCLVLEKPAKAVANKAFNVSDILLDRADLLAIVAEEARNAGIGIATPLPARADASTFNQMDCRRLTGLGWMPGGRPLFARTAAFLARQAIEMHKAS